MTTTIVKTADNHTLYAHWTANTYTVVFSPMGGSITTTFTNVTYDSAYGTLPEPTRTGYTFAGWNTKEDGTGDNTTDSTTVTIAAPHTLFAMWNINSYKLMFIFDNGSMSYEDSIVYNEPIPTPRPC